MNKYMIASITLFVLIIFSCMEKTDAPTQNLVEQVVEYTSDSTVMKGFLVYDSAVKEKRPGVLIVHEWWGLNDYARKRARMLAELGYTALALDMYGDGKQATHPEDAQKFAMSIFSNIKSGEDRFSAAYNFLKSQETVDSNNIASIGYCFGGGIVLHMARTGIDLKAIVSFHGGLEPVQPAEVGKVKATILVCNGAADPFVTQEQINAFKNEMDSAKVQYKFVNYEGSKHAFTNPAADSVGQKYNLPLAYNEKADNESWQEMKTLFEKVFSK